MWRDSNFIEEPSSRCSCIQGLVVEFVFGCVDIYESDRHTSREYHIVWLVGRSFVSIAAGRHGYWLYKMHTSRINFNPLRRVLLERKKKKKKKGGEDAWEFDFICTCSICFFFCCAFVGDLIWLLWKHRGYTVAKKEYRLKNKKIPVSKVEFNPLEWIREICIFLKYVSREDVNFIYRRNNSICLIFNF